LAVITTTLVGLRVGFRQRFFQHVQIVRRADGDQLGEGLIEPQALGRHFFIGLHVELFEVLVLARRARMFESVDPFERLKMIRKAMVNTMPATVATSLVNKLEIAAAKSTRNTRIRPSGSSLHCPSEY